MDRESMPTPSRHEAPPKWPSRVGRALRGARGPIAAIAAAYAAGVLAGATTVHRHDARALAARDALVIRASEREPALRSFKGGHRLRAAAFDFAGNLALGAIPTTVLGLGVVLPFPVVLYRGWIGGLVSVDSRHDSRLASRGEALYYIGVLVLQLIPYSLTGGAGVRLGLALLRPAGRYGYPTSARWAGLPAEGLRDVLRIYSLAVPLFALASLVEFFAR